jgi:hypothetical protein
LTKALSAFTLLSIMKPKRFTLLAQGKEIASYESATEALSRAETYRNRYCTAVDITDREGKFKIHLTGEQQFLEATNLNIYK